MAMIEPTTIHTEMLSGRPVWVRTAPMKTSSGPGPRPVHKVTATETAIVIDPRTRRSTRVENPHTRRTGRAKLGWTIT